MQGAAWCAKYVASFVPISSPWAGAASMLLTEVGGDNLGYPIPHVRAARLAHPSLPVPVPVPVPVPRSVVATSRVPAVNHGGIIPA